jgi:hypothetical protein
MWKIEGFRKQLETLGLKVIFEPEFMTSVQASRVTGDVALRLGRHVGDTGALALAQVVVSGPASVLLDLSGNLVGTVGAAALRARPSILTVNLTDNPNL